MVIILGASGYIGSQFVNELRNKDVGFLPLSRFEVDYYDSDILTDLIKETKARFLINCAGFTGKPNVDVCEDHQEETWEANAVLPQTLARVCESLNLPWGQVSSGCIYDGDNGGIGFSEDDAPNLTFELDNCSFYSGSKVCGEENIKNVGGKCYIWRLRIPFDQYDSPRNYLSKLMNYEKLLSATNSISHRADFVKACLQLWLRNSEYGTYNVVNRGPITTESVAARIKDWYKIKGIDKEFEFFSDDNEFYSKAAKAKRSNCVLDNRKLLAAGVDIRTADEAILDSLNNWKTS